MGRFTKIPQDAFEAMQLDAGMLLRNFSPASPSVQDSDIICATTGGVNVVCQPTFTDLGEDVDNVPNNMKEYKHLDSWTCSMSTTSLGTSPELLRLALGCADIDGTDTTKVTPRGSLVQTDFTTIWWVGDKADGGFVAVKLFNALSTDGLSLQTTKNGKGQTSLTLTGHVSINAQDVVPMEFYSIDAEGAANVKLSSLTVGTLTLVPAFSAAVTSYTAETTGASSVVTAAAQDSGATVEIKNGGNAVTNGGSASWAAGENTLTVAVSKGGLSKVYTVTVTRSTGA